MGLVYPVAKFFLNLFDPSLRSLLSWRSVFLGGLHGFMNFLPKTSFTSFNLCSHIFLCFPLVSV